MSFALNCVVRVLLIDCGELLCGCFGSVCICVGVACVVCRLSVCLCVAVLSDNSAVLSLLSSYSLPTRKFLSVPDSVAGRMLNAMMLYPPDFDPQVKYPVLIQVYGGYNSSHNNH